MIYCPVALRPETLELLQRCKEECLRQNPQLKGFELSNDYITKRIAMFYLDMDVREL